MSAEKPKVSRQLQHYLDQFESAVRAHATRGGAEKESRGEIEINYQFARLDLLRAIAALELYAIEHLDQER